MTPTGDTKPKLLFYERASWYWVPVDTVVRIRSFVRQLQPR